MSAPALDETPGAGADQDDPMDSDDLLIAFYDRAMALTRDASGLGRFEVAYHALMSALHAAEDQGDPDRLQGVADLADELGAKVNAIDPPHRLSSREAERRGHLGLYPMAARQARARAALSRRMRSTQERRSVGS